MLKGLLPAVVAAFMLAGGAAGVGPQKRVQAKRPAPAGSKPAAPPKVAEIDEAALKSLLGIGTGRAHPLLVNFWATWCGPCRAEFPDLVKLRGQYAEEKLDFILVSLDDPSDIGKAVPEFLSEQRATALRAVRAARKLLPQALDERVHVE